MSDQLSDPADTDADEVDDAASVEPTPANDDLIDWPADEVDADRASAGNTLAYYRPTPANRSWRRQITPELGIAAWWLGLISVLCCATACGLDICRGGAGSEAVLTLGGMTAVVAILIGTIGRANPIGEPSATVGRLLGFAMPLPGLLYLSIGNMLDQGAGGLMVALMLDLVYVSIAVILIAALDAIFGTH